MSGRTAVVMAWRKGEDDTEATKAAAQASVGKGGRVIAVEDTTRNGPARTRHIGLLAAIEAGCDVAIITDPHMRFSGKALRDMGRYVRKNGGLACALCHHNPACSLDGGAYAGATIAYRAEFRGRREALCWKWSPDHTPGPRPCVGGACYGFRLDWYTAVGQPLAALPGWGGDEEALSISAWYSGHMPAVLPIHVAHRYRDRPPWSAGSSARAQLASRHAIIHAVVQDAAARKELTDWQRSPGPEWPSRWTPPSGEAECWRLALARQPRGWAAWRAEVCGPDCIEAGSPPAPKRPFVEPTIRTQPRANYGADENMRHCTKCHSARSEVVSTRQTGRVLIRYRRCLDCGRRRVSREDAPAE